MTKSGLELSDGQFYHIQINGSEAMFEDRDGAIDYLRDHKEEIDLEEPDVQMAKVETGEEWAIEGVPWQNIAVQLL